VLPLSCAPSSRFLVAIPVTETTEHAPLAPSLLASALEAGGRSIILTADSDAVGCDEIRNWFYRGMPGIELEHLGPEELLGSVDEGVINVLLLPAAACGRCGLDILDSAYRLLQRGGLCVIFGPAQLAADLTLGGRDTPAPVWEYLKAQAGRRGFIEVGADPTRARKSVSPQHPWPLGIFRKDRDEQRLRIATVGTKHADQMRMLFQNVFSPNRMTAEHWRWKYGQGRGVGVGAWRGNQLVAHYGGVWRRVSFRGADEVAVQITDVMVSNPERGILRRHGAFFRTAASFPECFTGYGAKALIGFGFPSERHFRAAALRGLYAAIDRVVELEWSAAASAAGRRRFHRLTQVDAAVLRQRRPSLDRIWRSMKQSLPLSILGVRDGGYIEHRYLDNPCHEYLYAVLRAPLSGRWQALVVLGVEERTFHIRDIVGNIRYVPSVIETLRSQWLPEGGALHLWLTRSHEHRAPSTHCARRDLGIVVPHSIWSAGPPVETVENRWWLTSGDTDFL